MHRSVGMPIETKRDHGSAATRWYGFVFFGYVPPALLAGLEAARQTKAAGADMLRGGAFKPRTSPYSFQGLGEEGLRHLAEAREATGLPVITEVMESRDVDLVAAHADILQIG